MYEYRCRVIDIYDGDTLTLEVDLGFRIATTIRVRLLDVDTPEIRGPERPEGLLAQAFVDDWVQERNEAYESAENVSVWDGWPFIVRTKKTGKYGRWLADIRPWNRPHVDGEFSLVFALKTNGHDTGDWKAW
jgi:micrococcal nuclease